MAYLALSLTSRALTFFKAYANKSLLKREKCHGAEVIQGSVTMFVATNSDGSEKLSSHGGEISKYTILYPMNEGINAPQAFI